MVGFRRKRHRKVEIEVVQVLQRMGRMAAEIGWEAWPGFAEHVQKQLEEYDWPGNIRQLQNVVEQAAALSTTDLIPLNLISSALKENNVKIPTFDEARFEFGQRYLVRLLQMTGGNVAQAARLADRNRTDFYKILHRHHISPNLFKN